MATLVACGGSSDDSSAPSVVFDACAPLALVTSAPTSTQQAGITAAQDLWRDRGSPAIGRFAGETVEVRFEQAGSAFHGLYDGGMILINQDLTDSATLSIVIAHELGHAFGLQHVTDRESLMNPGNLTTPPTVEDQREIEMLWGTCD